MAQFPASCPYVVAVGATMVRCYMIRKVFEDEFYFMQRLHIQYTYLYRNTGKLTVSNGISVYY